MISHGTLHHCHLRRPEVVFFYLFYFCMFNAVIMFNPKRTHSMTFILIVFMWTFDVSSPCQFYTELSVSAIRGRNISLPCTVCAPVDGVYWYKHNSTGATDDDERVLVAREFLGKADPVPGVERLRISDDYSLVINNISVVDEKTYSCLVAFQTGKTEQGHTNLKVIALAEPLEPIIESCEVSKLGICTYSVAEDQPEQVKLVCQINDVRPPPRLTWKRSDGTLLEAAEQNIHEKDGLYNISSQLQVPKSDFDYQYKCEAEGEAVDGNSSMTTTFEVETGSRGIHGGLIVLITLIAAGIIIAIFVFLMTPYLKRLCSPAGATSSPLKQHQDNDNESSPLNRVQNERLLTEKILGLEAEIEKLNKERNEERTRLESKLQELESNRDDRERLLTEKNLRYEAKVEQLKKERNEERTRLESRLQELESNRDDRERLLTGKNLGLEAEVEQLKKEKKEERTRLESRLQELESNRDDREKRFPVGVLKDNKKNLFLREQSSEDVVSDKLEPAFDDMSSSGYDTSCPEWDIHKGASFPKKHRPGRRLRTTKQKREESSEDVVSDKLEPTFDDISSSGYDTSCPEWDVHKDASFAESHHPGLVSRNVRRWRAKSWEDFAQSYHRHDQWEF